MNKFILNTMNRKNLTREQLNDNTAAADADAVAAATAYTAAADAATAYTADADAVAAAYAAAAYAAAAYAAYAYAADTADAAAADDDAAADDAAKYWLTGYFEESNESRADYEAELKRDNSFREVK